MKDEVIKYEEKSPYRKKEVTTVNEENNFEVPGNIMEALMSAAGIKEKNDSNKYKPGQ